ncbi:MAG: hypothetical protein IH840_10800 [Candidatus Heimdallarchaeota archaeon]|nr:hypothetical protein [Candidatus Heimdallarchaeota archaeon]
MDSTKMIMSGTVARYESHITDIQTFTVKFPRLEVNALIYALGLEVLFFVTLQVVGRINDGLLKLTANDDIQIKQTGAVLLQSIPPVMALLMVVPVLIWKKKKKNSKLIVTY